MSETAVFAPRVDQKKYKIPEQAENAGQQEIVEPEQLEIDKRFAEIIQRIDNMVTPEQEEELCRVEMSKRGGSSQILLMSTWYGR